MNANDLKVFSQAASDQLFGHILPFWCGPAIDHEQGGWMGWLSNDLKPDRSKPKGLIVNSRILWTFSAAHRARPEKIFQQMADRSFDYLMTRFWDERCGGAFWNLNDAGRSLDDSKKIYGQAFLIYALAEYHQAFGAPAALARAMEVFGLVEQHAHDATHGGYWEVRRRDWSEAAADARLSDKDMAEKKSMNNHLHVLEAYTTLHRAGGNELVAQRLRELLGLFEERILDARTLHFHHFFDDAWKVRSDSYTFGHDIEGTWLLCEAAEELADAGWRKRTGATALRMADVTLREAVQSDGAICYEGRHGKIIDPGREWWPQAEAVIGFLNAFQLSGEDRFFAASRRVWDFIDRHLVDRVHGDWFWRITPEGRVDESQSKISEWKGPYHSGRACLETIHRLKAISTRQQFNP
ncbi:MAG: AGE family epimerase/isomerase [Verrucomicrobiota bacterium]|jgi:mannobiose 2-epimerase